MLRYEDETEETKRREVKEGEEKWVSVDKSDKRREVVKTEKEEGRARFLVPYDRLQKLPYVVPSNSWEGRSLQDRHKTVQFSI